MEITRLENTSLLLKLAGCTILLDCDINVKSLASASNLPIQYTWSEPIPNLDLVLISNSTKVRALPFLVKSRPNLVLMTDLVSKLGYILCEEWVDFDAEYMRKVSGTSSIYSKQDIKTIWGKVKSLSYNQITSYKDLTIVPLSSGHSLGACNWLIRWEDLCIGVCSDSCVDVARYPCRLDREILQSDLVVFSPTHSPTLQPYSQKELYSSLLEACRSLHTQSSLIIPVDSWHILELEGHIISAANAFNMPVLCMSASAKAYLSYAAGSTDWLNPSLKQRAYSPQNCFAFEQAKDKKLLQVFSSLQDGFGASLVPHCILLISHSSLKLGEADYVIEHYVRKGGLHSLFMIDPDFPLASSKINLQHFLVDKKFIHVGLSLSEIEEMITHCKRAVLPSSFGLNNVEMYDQRTVIDLKPQFVSLKSTLKAPGAVRGHFVYHNYRKMANFVDRAETIKIKLKDLGYEVIVGNYYNYCVLKVLGGEIIFRGKKTEIKGKTPDIRQALKSFLE